jgi:hypothetical protein
MRSTDVVAAEERKNTVRHQTKILSDTKKKKKKEIGIENAIMHYPIRYTYRSKRLLINAGQVIPRHAPLEISIKVNAAMRSGPPESVTPCAIPESA